MIQLTLCGDIPFDFLASCSSFLSSCGAVGPAHLELNVAIAAFSEIVRSCFPAIDPTNDKPFHIVWLTRNVIDFVSNISGNPVSSISLDSMVFDAAPGLGWCCLRQDQRANSDAPRVSLYCASVLAALRRGQQQPATLHDVAAAASVHVRDVPACVSTLESLGLVRTFDDGRIASVDVNHAAHTSAVPQTQTSASEVNVGHRCVSPLSLENVEIYVQICHVILQWLVRSHEGWVSQAQLIALLSQQESVSAHDVSQCIHFLALRTITKIKTFGATSYVRLARIHAAEPLPSFSNCTSQHSCDNLTGPNLERVADSGLAHVIDFKCPAAVTTKVVVFAPRYHKGEDATAAMFSMLPQPCLEFEDKAAVELFLSRIVSQLSQSLGISFLLAAKELMDCCGFPERVIIKYLDATIYSTMFPETTQPMNSPVSFSPGVHVVDVASAAAALAQCAVCFDSDTNITLIQMPCNHRLCEQCFSLCFLSDSSQHPYGNLPDEQTPVSNANAEGTPRCRNFFSCPTCKLPLPDEFWEKFPDYLVGAQRDRASDSRVSLEKVHCRIVTNALRWLRQHPSSTIANCVGSEAMKGRYVVALTAAQSVTCMGSTFDSVADFRNFTGNETPPSCGLSALQLSQWQRAARAAQEAEKPIHPHVPSPVAPRWPSSNVAPLPSGWVQQQMADGRVYAQPPAPTLFNF
jgi:hypothetical protein